MPLGYHVVFRAVDDRVLAPDPGRRRAFAALHRRIGRAHGLFAYGFADTHSHSGLEGGRGDLAGFIHDFRLAAPACLGFGLSSPSVTPIRDMWHAENVLRYIHRQDIRHATFVDTFREATSLPDLLGLRPDGAWLADRVRAILPRLSRTDLLRHWGLDELVEAFDLSLLNEAGAAAAGVAALVGNPAPIVRARRACVHAAEGVSAADVARVLDISARVVRKHRSLPVDSRMVRAVRLQIGVRLGTPVPGGVFAS